MCFPEYLLEFGTVQTYVALIGQMLYNSGRNLYNSHLFQYGLGLKPKVFKMRGGYTGNLFKLSG